jgi:hypothetical protein
MFVNIWERIFILCCKGYRENKKEKVERERERTKDVQSYVEESQMLGISL